MELIVKKKLLDQLDYFETQYSASPSPFDRGIVFLCRLLMTSIESGTFDDHSTQEEIDKVIEDATNTAQNSMNVFRKLEARAIQAEQERDEVNQYYSADRHIAEREKLREERNALLEGLKWYADEINYEPQNLTGGESDVQKDEGHKARHVIRSIIAKIEGRGEAKMNDYIDMGLYRKDGSKVYVNIEAGAELREFFELDDRDKEPDVITFFFPADTWAITTNFFFGLFKKSVLRFGSKEAFLAKYNFSCTNDLMEDINLRIEEVLKRG